MVSLNEETAIPSPPDVVWPLLSDPAAVASCIPGAELAPDRGDGVWRGSIRVKFGPTVAIFRGEANLTFDHEARRIAIEGRGIDGRGASRALASGTVTATGGNTTTLSVSGEFNVTGPLETFASSGGVHVARALLAEFSGNMAKLVAERSGTPAAAPAEPEAVAPPAPPPEPRRAAELSGFAIAWRAFLSWLKGLIGKGR
jgi:carbon monoxide dehydrogenase subunit G